VNTLEPEIFNDEEIMRKVAMQRFLHATMGLPIEDVAKDVELTYEEWMTVQDKFRDKYGIADNYAKALNNYFYNERHY